MKKALISYTLQVLMIGALVLVIPFVIGAQIPLGPDWRTATEGKTVWVYYNRARMTRPSPKVVSVWVQFVDNKTVVKKSLSLYNFNCSTQMMRVLSETTYGESGDVMRSINPRSPSWEHIPPDTIADTLFDIVCRGGKDIQEIQEDEAANYFNKGMAAEKKKQYSLALYYYESSNTSMPDDPKVLAAIERMKAVLAKR